MKRWLVAGSLVVMGTSVLACGSDDDDPSGSGGTSSGGSGGTSSGGSGGSAGASTGGSAGSSAAGVDCAELCSMVAPLGCSHGPPSESLCVAFCQGTSTSTSDPTCAAAMNGVLDCESLGSDMSCTGDGYITSTACATVWPAMNPCLPAI